MGDIPLNRYELLINAEALKHRWAPMAQKNIDIFLPLTMLSVILPKFLTDGSIPLV
jgi:hypothetical protein